MSDPFLWLALVASVVSCFFASCHQAFHFFSSVRLEDIAKKKDRLQVYEYLITERSGLMWLTATLRSFLNLVVIVAFLAYFKPEITSETVFWWALGKSMLISGLIILTLGVAVPSSVGRYAPESILFFSYRLLKMTFLLCAPFMVIFKGMDWVVRRLIGWEPPDEDEPTALEQEIMDAVAEGEKMGEVDEAQKERIEAVMDFPTITTGEIMTPRTDICGINIDWEITRVKDFISEMGHSRFPVYEKDLDNILGLLYVKDLLEFVGNSMDGFDMKSMLRTVYMVPGSKPVDVLLEEFQQNKVHIAIVLDEFGGTAGMVTVEDIIEELVGDIHDEHEKEEEDPGFHHEDNVYLIDARMHIDDVNDDTDLELPDDDDYETVGGFVFNSLGHVPEVGETFVHENMKVTVIEAERTRVSRVKIELIPESSTLDQVA